MRQITGFFQHGFNLMNAKFNLSDLDLASLLASRVCHDVIGPVGAIVNGLEMLEEDSDEEMREIAMDLVKKSATSASIKLKFSRLAFGAAGSAGMEIDLSEAGEISVEFSTTPRVQMEWNCPHQTRPKNQVKLLMNMILIGITTIPRGGVIKVTTTQDREHPHYEVRCSGAGAKFPENVGALMRAEVNVEDIDARDVQVYYTGLVARLTGLELSTQIFDDEAVFIAAAPRPGF